MLSRERLEGLTDVLAAAYSKLKTDPANFPRTAKVSDLARDYLNLAARVGDSTALTALLPSARILGTSASADALAALLLKPCLQALNDHFATRSSALVMKDIDDLDAALVHFNTFNAGLSAPIAAPTLTPAATGGGLALLGTYRYAITFYRDEDESGIGSSEVAVTLTGGQNVVALSALPVGPSGTKGRRIWRSGADGTPGTMRLVAKVADNTTLTYTDAASDTDIEFSPLYPLPFGALVHPTFADLYTLVLGAALSAAIGKAGRGVVMSPAIGTRGTTTGDGMGTYTIGGLIGYTDGDAVDTTKYAGVELEVEVVAAVTGGSVAPVVTITGTDTDGNSSTWTATFDASNPALGTVMGATNTNHRRCIAINAISLNGSSGTAGKFRVNGLLERDLP